ncbi:MAG: hypothetical protein LBF93_02230 [Zoogloeaceae bacterium]|jgi:hypothetical protein|nr:hypothetical protein [Zoogloeaceae bacterium]
MKPQPLPMEQVAQIRQAAEQPRDIFREDLQVELDYDEESVCWLDGYIKRTCQRSDEHQVAINFIGSFLGECSIRNYGEQ